MIDNHNISHPSKVRPLMKWVWTSDYGGPLIGVVGFVIGIVGVSVAILAINIGNNTDLPILRYIAKAIAILCYIFVGSAFLLGAFGFFLTAFSTGKRIASVFGLFKTKND